MIPIAYKPQKLTKQLSLLITKKTDKLIQQTQTKEQENLGFNLTKSRQSFSFDIVSRLDGGDWMLALTSLEVSDSTPFITNENYNFEKSRPVDKKEKRFSSEKMRNQGEIFRPENLEDKLLGPVVIDNLKKLSLMT